MNKIALQLVSTWMIGLPTSRSFLVMVFIFSCKQTACRFVFVLLCICPFLERKVECLQNFVIVLLLHFINKPIPFKTVTEIYVEHSLRLC